VAPTLVDCRFVPMPLRHGRGHRPVTCGIVESMESRAGCDLADVAVLTGGPFDGREHPDKADSGELGVVMTNGQQHRYQWTGASQLLLDGPIALLSEWRSRYLGPI
jgi:hypothetical protein